MSWYLYVPCRKRMHVMATQIPPLNEEPAPGDAVFTASNVSGVGHCRIALIQLVEICYFQKYINHGLGREARH